MNRVRGPGSDRSATYLAVFVAYCVVLADQVTKAIVARADVPAATARNTGLVLGIGAGPALAILLLSTIVMFTFVALIGRSMVRLGVPAAVPALVVGGFLGNTLDRMRFGSVRDFIHAGAFVFNIADLAIVLGILASVLALAVRAYQLRRDQCVVRFDVRRLRPEIDRSGRL
jgi:lipoprotein signal peptidase